MKKLPCLFRCHSCDQVYYTKASRWIPHDEERDVKICRKCYNKQIKICKMILENDKRRTSKTNT